MKIAFRNEDSGRSAVVVTRDIRSGRDSEAITLKPGAIGNVDIDENSFLVITAGVAVEATEPTIAPQTATIVHEPETEEEDEDEDEGQNPGEAQGADGPPATLQVNNPTREETIRAEAFDAAKAGGASDEDAVKAADEALAADRGEGPAAETDQEQQEKVELRDANDNEVTEVIRGLHETPTTDRTKSGYVEVAAVNKALADAGFNPINAERRTSLSDASNLVKSPEA